jgi:hypothetical protein
MAIPPLTRRDVDEFNSITTSAPPRPAGPAYGARPAPQAAAPSLSRAPAAPAATPAVSPPPMPARPVFPAATALGRQVQGQVTRPLPGVNTAQANFRVGRDNASYLNAMSMGPPVPGNTQPYQAPRPFRPSWNPGPSDLLNDNATPSARTAAIQRPVMPVMNPTLRDMEGAGAVPANAPAASAAPQMSGPVAPTVARPRLAAPPGLLARAAGAATAIGAGTTSAAQGASRPAAVSQGGRQLPYGQMVNGVPTFSDGSGIGRIPRTMTDQQIGALAGGAAQAPALARAAPAAIPAAAPGGVARPTPGGSAVAGADAAPTLFRPQRPALPQQPAGPSALELQRYAASDMASIASGDVRSPLGAAARNLRSQMQYGTPAQRAAAAKQLEALSAGVAQGFGNVGDAQVQAGTDQSRLAAEQLRAQTDLQRTGMETQGRLQEATITRPRPQFDRVTLEDGTVALVGEDGASRYATGPDGKPLRTTLPRQATLQQSDRLKAINDLAQSMGGVNGVTEDTYRQAATLIDGGQAAARPSLDQFMAAARQQNPGVGDDELRAYYAQNYGG